MKQPTLFCHLTVVVVTLCTYLDAQQAPQGSGPETVEAVEKIGVQGSWVKKREMLLKSNEVNQQIQELAGQIEPIRKSFMDRYATIDAALDTYYKTIGLEQGKLQELFDDIVRYIEKKRAKEIAALGITQGQPVDPELQAKIDVIENSVTEAKQKLEQLKLDMKSVEDLDHSLSDRIKRVDETITSISTEATRANEIVEGLWSVIDHNKARDNYYDLTNNILEKIKSYQSYLNTDLSQDFDTVISTVQTQITTTQESIKKLEEDGLFIKNRAERVKEEKIKAVAKKEALETQTTVAKVLAQKPVVQVSWYTNAYNHIAHFVQSLYNGLIIIKANITNAFWPNPKNAKSAATPKPASLPPTTETVPNTPVTVPAPSQTQP